MASLLLIDVTQVVQIWVRTMMVVVVVMPVVRLLLLLLVGHTHHRDRSPDVGRADRWR